MTGNFLLPGTFEGGVHVGDRFYGQYKSNIVGVTSQTLGKPFSHLKISHPRQVPAYSAKWGMQTGSPM